MGIRTALHINKVMYNQPKNAVVDCGGRVVKANIPAQAAFPLSGVTAYLTHKILVKTHKKERLHASSDAKDFPVDAQFHMAVRQVDAVIA